MIGTAGIAASPSFAASPETIRAVMLHMGMNMWGDWHAPGEPVVPGRRYAKDEIFFTMPTMVAVILLLVFWEALFPVMIIALFFGVRYSFDGAGSAETANRVLNRAGDFANDVKNEFTGSNNSGSAN